MKKAFAFWGAVSVQIGSTGTATAPPRGSAWALAVIGDRCY